MEVFITWRWFLRDRQRFEMWCSSIAPFSIPAVQQGAQGRSTSTPLSPADKEQENVKDDDAEMITSLPHWSQSSVNFSSTKVLISLFAFNWGLAERGVIHELGVEAGGLGHHCPPGYWLVPAFWVTSSEVLPTHWKHFQASFSGNKCLGNKIVFLPLPPTHTCWKGLVT